MACVPTADEFIALAQDANIIPVYREIIADIDTPVSALAKLGPGRCAFLLESVEGGERLGRYSFLGNSALMTFRSTGEQITIEHQDGTVHTEIAPDALARLEQLLADFKPATVSGLPRFFGGAVGYVGFDAVLDIDSLPRNGSVPADTNPSDIDATGNRRADNCPPDIMFIFTDAVLIFDHVRRKIQIVVNAQVNGDAPAAYARATERIEHIVTQLQQETQLRPLSMLTNDDDDAPSFQANVTPEQFYDAVRDARERVRSGEVFQVVLSVRLSAELKAHPFDVYRLLRSVNPSPYMFYFDFGPLHLVGSSPEVMVRLEDGQALLRPIAGTRRRGESLSQDDGLAKDLLADEKERAEHIMLVDLGRNDLGRVCEYGSVRVDELMSVEKYSHVMHIASNVRGDLSKDRSAFDLLRATFPAGTVSGAPKHKALQIIDELEAAPRGPYGGAVGYFGFSGNMDSCIAIRTIVIHDGKAHVQAGAGIVADSDPDKEYKEIHDKAQALLQTIALAQEVSA